MCSTPKINSLFLTLAPALSVYQINESISLIFIIIPFFILVNLVSIDISKIYKKRKTEIIWFFSIIVISILGCFVNLSQNYFSFNLFVNNFVSLSLFFIALILFTSNINAKVLKKTLYVMALSAAMICIFQRTQLLLTGTFWKDFFLPGLTVKRDLESFSTMRVSAFFTEPAHLSIYLLPVFYMALKEKKIFFTFLIGIGILFSGSTTGLLIMIALILYYSIAIVKKKTYIIPIFFMLLGLYWAILYFFPVVISDNLEKINSTDSGGMRLLGPLISFTLFDVFQWAIGIGFNQLSDFLSANGIYFIDEWGGEINSNYANAFLYMIISYGIIGFICFIRYLFKRMNAKCCDIGFSIITIGILLSDQVLFNMNLLYLLTFVILSRKILDVDTIYYNHTIRLNNSKK